MTAYYTGIKRQIERTFASILTERLGKWSGAGRQLVEFFPSKGDDERELPFGVIHVESAKPTLGGRDPRAYLCDVRIIFVSHIDEVGSEEHSQIVSNVEDILSQIPNNQMPCSELDDTHITINGIFISDMQTASQDQSHGDVFFVTAGVSKCVS